MSPFFKKRLVKSSPEILRTRGFSLIELLVSISIMVAIITVVVFGQRGYTESARLLNLADEIGLSVSQAQAYGIAVRETATGSANFNSAYGLSLTLLEAGGSTAYIYFSDLNNNQYYDGSLTCSTSECMEKIIISGGNYIESFCALRTSGSDQCGGPERVDISFKRPETDASIFFFNSGGQSYNVPNLEGVRINLRSPRGLTRSVTVYLTGQVSVQ